jgi:hypothetical protein
MLTAWLQTLHDWEVAALLRRSVYVYPFVNAAHILSLTLLIGGILPADLRILGWLQGAPSAPLLRLMTTMSAIGLGFAILTGFLLFSVQPLEYVGNPAFLTKITLVALGTANALIIRFSVGWRLMLATGEAGAALRTGAILSLFIWIAALISGRWIAFV